MVKRVMILTDFDHLNEGTSIHLTAGQVVQLPVRDEDELKFLVELGYVTEDLKAEEEPKEEPKPAPKVEKKEEPKVEEGPSLDEPEEEEEPKVDAENKPAKKKAATKKRKK